MKLLITGSDNYIAKSFCEKYAKRHKMTTLESDTDIGDIKSLLPIFKKKKFDAILHFAEVFGSPDQTDKEIEIINTIMFKNIQSLAKAYDVKKLLAFSNIRELETSGGMQAFKESEHTKYMPLDSYGQAKHNITNMARIDKSVFVLRSFEVYGKDAPDSVLTTLISEACQGKNLSVEKDIILSVIYIEDYLKIINDFLMHSHPAGDYNITGDELISVNDVLKKLKRSCQDTISISTGKERLEFTASNDKLNAVIGAFKFTTLRSALNKIVKAYKDDI